MLAIKILSNIINAMEGWEEDFEEEVSENVEDLLAVPGIWEKPKNTKTIDKLDKLLLLLDPKFKDYLEDESYKLPVDGKVKS